MVSEVSAAHGQRGDGACKAKEDTDQIVGGQQVERVHAGASNGGFRGEGASHEGGENVPMLQWSGVDDVSDSDVDVDESNGGNIEMQELGQVFCVM